ncbi:MAG: thermonuclease family protein [Chitinophagaceae bacterium]|nr:thermonuclease family protein [Chitinophagaceae bacterium]
MNSFAQSTLTGKAVRILDGDTFEILVNGHSLYKVRLTDIDAPEKRQDFGQVSKQALATRIFGREVKVIYEKLDRNKRILGHLYVGDEYINLTMVSQGLAWHYKKYSNDQRFAIAENKARNAKKGLWINPHAVAPWVFRKIRK